MPLSEAERRQIDQLFTEFCATRLPATLRSQVQVNYRVRGNEVTLFASRPLNNNPQQLMASKVAQFNKVPGSTDWRLFWYDNNGSWRAYAPLSRHSDLAALLDAVEQNATGVFWR